MLPIIGITATLLLAIFGCDGDNSKSDQGDSNISSSGNVEIGSGGGSDQGDSNLSTSGDSGVNPRDSSYDSYVPHDARQTRVEADTEIIALDSAVDVPAPGADGTEEVLDASYIDNTDSSDVLPVVLIHEAVDDDNWAVVPPLHGPQSIALDETSVFVSYHMGGSGQVSRGLLKIDKLTGTSLILLEAQCYYPSSMTVQCFGNREGMLWLVASDETHLYLYVHHYQDIWGMAPPSDTYAVVKTTKSGDLPVVLHEEVEDEQSEGIENLIVDDTNVYWTKSWLEDRYKWTIMMVGKDGGTPVTLASGNNKISNIAVDDTSVYWAKLEEDRSIFKLDKHGGSPVVLASDPDESSFGVTCQPCIALDDTHIYFGHWGDRTIRKMDKSAGESIELAPITHLQSIVVDETSVYWRQTSESLLVMPDLPTAKFEFLKVDKSGGAVTAWVDIDQFSLFAVDDDFIYAAIRTDPFGPLDYRIKRIEK